MTDMIINSWQIFAPDLEIQKIDSDTINHSELIVSAVQITGGWSGSVLVSCDTKSATQITANVYGEEAEEISPSRVNDLVAEIINLIGGYFISDLPITGSQPILSTPATTRTNDAIYFSSKEILKQLTFKFDIGGKFDVYVLQSLINLKDLRSTPLG
jgi:CheY-specific phosphatase CheX